MRAGTTNPRQRLCKEAIAGESGCRQFLSIKRRIWSAAQRSGKWYHQASYLVTQPHHTTRGRDSDETTRNKSLDTDFLGRLGQRNLVLLLGRADAANNNIDVGQRFDELLLWGLEITFSDRNTSLLQLDDGGLVDRDWADEGDHLLHN